MVKEDKNKWRAVPALARAYVRARACIRAHARVCFCFCFYKDTGSKVDTKVDTSLGKSGYEFLKSGYEFLKSGYEYVIYHIAF